MKNEDDDRSFEAIGKRLELTRQVFGYQQNEFCQKAGIAENTYNQYEKGQRRPSVDMALRLVDAFGITLDWIYRGDPSGLHHRTAEAIKALRQARKP